MKTSYGYKKIASGGKATLGNILPARSSYENIAAPLKLTSLVEDTGATICHHALHHRALGKLPRLVVNLDGQLPGSYNEIEILTNFITDEVISSSTPGRSDHNALGTSSRISIGLNQAVDDGKQEGGSLARASLHK